MSNPKRHHYLPEFYLHRFADPKGYLWLFDRSQNKFRRERPKNTAVIGHYYSLTDDSGVRNPVVEEYYSLIEDRAKEAFEELESGAKFTESSRYSLSHFLGHLYCRVPAFARALNEIISGFAKAIVRKNLDDPETATGFDLPPEEIREAIEGDDLLVEANDALRISDSLKKGEEFRERFFESSWVVAKASGGTSFVTCDNPFGFIYPPGIHNSYKAWSWGAGTPQVTIVFPLSVRTCLLIHGMDGLSLERVEFNRDLVRKANLAIISETETYALARDEAHLRSLVRAEDLYSMMPSTRMIVESYPDPTGDPTKSTLVVRRAKVRGA
jgi:hypothetical protein